jgi:hypothetical protein
MYENSRKRLPGKQSAHQQRNLPTATLPVLQCRSKVPGKDMTTINSMGRHFTG